MNYFQRLLVTRKLRSNFYGLNQEKLFEHQTRISEELWAYVRTHSPYYQALYPAPVQFSEVAPCNKATMMAHFNEINTEKLDRDHLVNFRIEKEKTGQMEYYQDGYSIGLSSGTSGNRLLTVLSKRERDLYTCLLWARSGIPESVKSYHVLFALRTYNPAFTEVGVFGISMIYVDYTHPVETLIELINTKRLNILAGPPSLLLMIARKSAEISHPIDAVISYAEVLDDNAKSMLMNEFQAPVIQIYQGAEGFIGTTCRNGYLHINEDVLLVEPVGDQNEGPVSVLLTDLFRRTQPFIRYHLDDMLEIDTASCSCGSVFRRIKRIHGRADDVFVLLDEEGRPRYLFPDYVRRAINQASESILEYQAIQHSHHHIEIRIAISNESHRDQIEAEVLKNLSWRAERVGAKLGVVEFSGDPPERNERSRKMVRVVRKFPWNY